MINLKKIIFALILTANLVALSSTTIAAAPSNKVTICHHTGSVANPYTKITVPSASTGGHFDNDGNPLHGGDLLFQGDVECPTTAPTSVPEFTTITTMITLTVAGIYLFRKYSFQ